MEDINEWDLTKLKEDMKKLREMRDDLLSSNAKIEKSIESTEETIKHLRDEENIWKTRYLKQQAYNQELENELAQLQQYLKRLQINHADDHQFFDPVQDSDVIKDYESMSDAKLRQELRKLEREKTEQEWQLKEYGWRLDQTSAAYFKYSEEKKTILAQIGHTKKMSQRN